MLCLAHNECSLEYQLSVVFFFLLVFAFLGLWVAKEKTKVYLWLEVVRSRDREINGSLGWEGH